MNEHEHHRPVPREDQVNIAPDDIWHRLPLISAAIGAVGIIVAVALMYTGHDAPTTDFGYGFEGLEGLEGLEGEHGGSHGGFDKGWAAYLTAVMTGLALSLGGLFFTLIQHAARAGWSIVVRRIAENAMLTLPLMGVLALPVVFMGAHDLYHWTHTEAVAADPVLQAKEPYLNEGRFQTFAVVYFAIWTILAVAFWRWSTRQDTAADPKPYAHRMRWFAPLGLVLFGLSLTFAAFDWLMSLDPHWFSTMFGVYYFAGGVVSIHAFLALMCVLLHRAGYLRGVVTAEHYHDIGKFMFAFSVFWAYIAFSQYFLIWYASIPEETMWFEARGEGQWLVLSIALVFVRFVMPFIFIMSRHFKRNPRTLMFWAAWILVGQYIDMYWLVQPHEGGTGFIGFMWIDVAWLVGVLGLWFAVFSWGLTRKPMVPLRDPRLAESLVHENF